MISEQYVTSPQLYIKTAHWSATRFSSKDRQEKDGTIRNYL